MNAMDKILEALRKAEDEVKSTNSMQKIAQVSAEMVRDRVRNEGKGVTSRGATQHNLAPLMPSTIRNRMRKSLHPSTSPARSNLTESGQLLDALHGKGVRKGVGEIALKSRRSGSRLTNDEVAFFVSGKRPFIDLSAKEIKALEEATADKTQRLFDQYLSEI